MDEADLTPEEESPMVKLLGTTSHVCWVIAPEEEDLLAELEDQDDSEVVDKRTSERT